MKRSNTLIQSEYVEEIQDFLRKRKIRKASNQKKTIGPIIFHTVEGF